MDAEEVRTRARLSVVVFAATLALGVALLVVYAQDIQTVDAAALVRRQQEVRAFFTADFCFIVFYGIAAPLALWWFGGALRRHDGRIPRWIGAAAALLATGAIVDALENVLLLTAANTRGQPVVDMAHFLAIPKYAFAGVGTLLALPAVAMAVRAMRVGAAAPASEPGS